MVGDTEEACFGLMLIQKSTLIKGVDGQIKAFQSGQLWASSIGTPTKSRVSRSSIQDWSRVLVVSDADWTAMTSKSFGHRIHHPSVRHR